MQLTLLQQSVIQRLRDAGFDAVAELAQDNWSAGRPIPGVTKLSDSLDRRSLYLELLQDFDRANAQATA